MRNRGTHCPHSEKEKCFSKTKSSTVSTTARKFKHRLSSEEKKIGPEENRPFQAIQSNCKRAMTTSAILQDARKK